MLFLNNKRMTKQHICVQSSEVIFWNLAPPSSLKKINFKRTITMKGESHDKISMYLGRMGKRTNKLEVVPV